VIGYDFTQSGKAGLTRLGTCSGSDSGKVPSSDSSKELGMFSGKNLGKRPGKKSGKELPDRVRTQVRRPGKTKTCKTRGLLCFMYETFLYMGTSSLYKTDSTRR
jgi:hypothetical protein